MARQPVDSRLSEKLELEADIALQVNSAGLK